MRKGLILAVMVLGAGWGAPAALAEEKIIVTEQAPHAYNPDEVVCRKSDPPVGSRIGRAKVCHTNARWKQIRMDSDDAVRIMQDRDAWNTHLQP